MARKCWAVRTGGCSDGMSDEHPISQAIFDAEVLDIHGAQWLPEELRQLPLKRLYAQVLCGRHNGLLSPLDSAIGTFAKDLRRLNVAGSKGHLSVDGPTLERWCVKALLGILAGGWHRPHGNHIVLETPPQDLVEFAFGIGSLRAGCGLHVLSYECTFEQGVEAIAWQILVGNEIGSHILGLLVGLPPLAFVRHSSPATLRRCFSTSPHAATRTGRT